MNFLSALSKPWYLFRPSQMLRRAVASASVKPGFQNFKTSWGARLFADPTKGIGWSLLSTGIYDIAVSEAIARLIVPGSTVIDAGANIGCMTTLAAACTGPTGRVHAFEPHPVLHGILQQNIDLNRFGAQTKAHQLALGSSEGSVELMIPTSETSNDGTAFIKGAQTLATSRSMVVKVTTLDAVLAGQRASVMKIDIEGYEHEALLGAAESLSQHRIDHIIFEDLHGPGSPVMSLLISHGYEIFSLNWSLLRLELKAICAGQNRMRQHEAPSYIASCRKDALLQACARPGWRVLNRLVDAPPP